MCRISRCSAALVAPLLLAAHLAAQQLEPQPVPNRGVESYRDCSPLMGRRYDITVGLPVAYDAARSLARVAR